MLRKKIDILLVEDNPGDIRLLREALDECRVNHRLEVATDGVKALECLRREKSIPFRPLPDLILLDLNLPVKDGREVLMEIKTDETLRRIPVVVLSSSTAEEDIRRSYDHHANCYICKPLDFDAFIEVVDSLGQFWLQTVKLPEKARP